MSPARPGRSSCGFKKKRGRRIRYRGHRKGTIELSVDGAGVSPTAPRKVTGDAKGPLDRCGSRHFDARSSRQPRPERREGSECHARFMTLLAEGPAALKGVLRVSNGNAPIVREASVELAHQ